MTVDPGSRRTAVAVMLMTPLFFSTNIIFGRGVVGEVAPFTLAMIRWGTVALVLAAFAWRDRRRIGALLRGAAPLVVFLAFLGMWVCGALVYVALGMTTATNGTLIYTTSPVFIILFEALFAGRRIGWREAVGSAIALLGVAVIILQGQPARLLALEFNAGDLLFLSAAIAWAVYSILFRRPQMATITNLSALSLLAGTGALLLAPFALWEYLSGAPMPTSLHAWQGIGGIVLFASLLAFLGFQHGIRGLGAATAGVFMYLLPVYGVLLAVVALGERFQAHHAAGILLVLGGVILATLPASWLARS